jgi:hypothetical protein
MTCPICGQTITFPAIPPGGTGKIPALRIKRPEAPRARSFFDFGGALASLRQFKHWNVVLVCFVPFIVVGALLAGASVVKKQFGDAPATPGAAPAAPIQADTNAWQKMTDLAGVEQTVQAQVRAVSAAKIALATAQQRLAVLHSYYHGKSVDQATYNGLELQKTADEKDIANADRAFNYATRCFDAAFQKYQQLGGTVDYRAQLPH